MNLKQGLVILIVVLLVVLVYFQFYQLEPYYHLLPAAVRDVTLRKEKVILIYTTSFGNPNWHGLQETKINTYTRDIRCEHSCLITYNKTRIVDADAVVFHARDVENHRYGKYSARELESERNRALFRQKWIFLSHENPQGDKQIYAPYKQLFNWTATFSRKSDIFIPYGKFKKTDQSKRTVKNYASGKKGFAAWAVSNCLRMRLEYAMQLQRYIPLTVYGRCRHSFVRKGECKPNSPDCEKELSNYKFYLAFENDFCEDYVTEKYWMSIMRGNVPVVMGATYDESLVIPGSYIDTSKFDSIKALADYLNYLNNNDTAYNEYFAWKSYYIKDVTAAAEFYCEVCTEVSSDKFDQPKLMYISEVFNKRKTCDEPFRSKHDKYLKQIEDSKQGKNTD